MGASKIVVSVASLAVGFGLGVAIGTGVGTRAKTRVGEVQTRVDTSVLDALRAENARLKAELAEHATVPLAVGGDNSTKPAAGATSLERLQVLADMQQRRWITPFVQVLERTGDGRLTAQFAELFALTPDEHTRLQEIVDRTRDRLAPLERENATVTRAEDDTVTITVRPFPQQGGAIYDEFMKAFANVLGPERHSAFLVLGAQNMEKSLGWLGAAEQTFTFSVRPGAFGSRNISVQRGHRLPRENGTSGSSFKTIEEAATWAGPIAALLPKDFRPAP